MSWKAANAGHAECLVHIDALVRVPARFRPSGSALPRDQAMHIGDGIARIGSGVIGPRGQGHTRVEEIACAKDPMDACGPYSVFAPAAVLTNKHGPD